MKKLHPLKKVRLKKTAETEQDTKKITTGTVEHHRERIISTGRKFKYPVQYAKHRLVFNSIAISVIALVVIISGFAWMLYSQQNTSMFFYRITKVLPVPVAYVDGYSVRYSYYLDNFNSQRHYLENIENLNLYSTANKTQLNWYKRQALNAAVVDGYVEKLAKKYNITVSERDIDDAITKQRKATGGSISESAYYVVAYDHYGWSKSDLRDATKRSLLKKKVSFYIDKTAAELKKRVESALSDSVAIEDIKSRVGSVDGVSVDIGAATSVPYDNHDDGLSTHALKLEKGQYSGVFESNDGNGYYVVQLTAKTSQSISYSYIKIPLSVLNKKINHLRSSGHIKELIKVPLLDKK